MPFFYCCSILHIKSLFSNFNCNFYLLWLRNLVIFPSVHFLVQTPSATTNITNVTSRPYNTRTATMSDDAPQTPREKVEQWLTMAKNPDGHFKSGVSSSSSRVPYLVS